MLCLSPWSVVIVCWGWSYSQCSVGRRAVIEGLPWSGLRPRVMTGGDINIPQPLVSQQSCHAYHITTTTKLRSKKRGNIFYILKMFAASLGPLLWAWLLVRSGQMWSFLISNIFYIKTSHHTIRPGVPEKSARNFLSASPQIKRSFF